MPVSIGVDVGLLSIKVAVLDGTAKLPRVVAFHHHKLSDGLTTTSMDREELVDLLRSFIDEKKIPAAVAASVGTVPASSALSREITIPFNKPELIRKVIKGQAEAVFQAISIDDLIVDFYKLADYGEKSRCLVIGVKKEILKARIETLEAAGFDVAAV
jgi:Tfp pilus assembly PilM family ATPase